MWPRASLFVLLLVTALVAGCGSVRVAYSQLDWLVPWSLRDYLRLNGEQRSLFEARLAEQVAWHCASELPAYAEFLREVERDLAVDRVEVATLERHADRIESFVRVLGEALAHDVADILAASEDGQIARLARRFEQRDDEDRAKYVDAPAAQRHDERVERMERRLRRWFGRMDSNQRAMVEAWSRELEPVAEDWLARRTAWQASFVEALRMRSARPEFDVRIRSLLLDADAQRAPDYEARLARNRERSFELLAKIHHSASAAQRGRLSRELHSLIGQFDVLACAGPAPTATRGSSSGLPRSSWADRLPG